MGFRGTQQTAGLGGKALRAGVVLAALAVALLLPATALAMAPTATTQPASNITATSAFLNGTVNSNDKQATWHFDYATQAEFGTSGTYPHSTSGGSLQICFVVCVPILNRDVGVGETISNLTPNTTYHFRVEATNADGTTYGQDLTFRTLKR